MDLRTDARSNDVSSTAFEGQLPGHQMSMWWSLQVSRSIDADAIFRYVDALPALRIVPYRALDARLGVHALTWLDMSMIAQNVFDEHHREFGRSPGFPGLSEIPTTYALKLDVKL